MRRRGGGCSWVWHALGEQFWAEWHWGQTQQKKSPIKNQNISLIFSATVLDLGVKNSLQRWLEIKEKLIPALCQLKWQNWQYQKMLLLIKCNKLTLYFFFWSRKHRKVKMSVCSPLFALSESALIVQRWASGPELQLFYLLWPLHAEKKTAQHHCVFGNWKDENSGFLLLFVVTGPASKWKSLPSSILLFTTCVEPKSINQHFWCALLLYFM